ncbi:hypothetical protein M408DRAFT_211528 [Serendipita vermifera MAFF 305830]|uniref:Lysine-specific metallo-endopeptidase domain-containing protein n=1 Tax=Serendipita vermifera MAFF 305830 TaxID=933852 RepID=A0A0C3AZT1_SERVB|nr:hypothetical protein M408DRAFT_211528 [Serendipita vermifera MAFF 305830]
MFSSLLSLLLVVPLIAAIPVPLEAEFVENPAAHAGSKAKFDEALGVANTQIANMKNVLDNHPNDPRIAQAFGPNPNLGVIQGNVNKLATKTMKVQTSDPSFADNTHGGRVNGFVPVDTGSGERVTSPAQFGSTFYSGNSEADKKFRAGTIIHEATHYLGATGDHVAPGSKIVRAGAKQPDGTVRGGGRRSPDSQ